MSDKNFAFANIVSTPTAGSWSQAYHAGKLFAVLSLRRETSEDQLEEEPEKETLGSLGKTFFTSLEQEFFTLEEKDLDSIKSAIEVSLKKIPDDVEFSLGAGSVIGDIFYLFCTNKARVDFHREDQTATLLIGESNNQLRVASGRLTDKDIAIIQTDQFNQLVDSEKLYSSLDHFQPSEIAENLAPSIHDKEEGGAAAIIIQYKKPEEEYYAVENFTPSEKIEHSIAQKEEPLTAEPISETQEKKEAFLQKIKKNLKLPGLGKVNASRKMILAVIVIIAIVFSGSIYLNVKRQNDAKIKALFDQVYSQVQNKYDEGQSLSELNQSLAHDSFVQAKKLLDDANGKFPKDSEEEKKINELAQKVDQALGSTSGVNSVSAKEVDSNESNMLSLEKEKELNYVFSSDKNLYYLDDNGVSIADKNGDNSKTLIKNDKAWATPGGLAFYFGNFYVLDKKAGILKFVSGGDGYGKSSYFTKDTSPNLSKASAIAIDGSIWIIFSDGNIAKFTRGTSDNLKVTGLDIPFNNPTRIWTSVDSDKVYILDKGNSRIVVLDKSGTYKEQYQAGVIKNAKDFDIQETAKKILILSNGKIYQLSL